MFHKWPKIREFSLALVHHSSQGCVGSQKAHGQKLPILIIITALSACSSPKISLGHTFPWSCQHPCTWRIFHIYIGKKDKFAMTILTERQFTWWKTFILSDSPLQIIFVCRNWFFPLGNILMKLKYLWQNVACPCSHWCGNTSSHMVLNAHVRKPIPPL